MFIKVSLYFNTTQKTSNKVHIMNLEFFGHVSKTQSKCLCKNNTRFMHQVGLAEPVHDQQEKKPKKWLTRVERAINDH
jgi:hypothetical protein